MTDLHRPGCAAVGLLDAGRQPREPVADRGHFCVSRVAVDRADEDDTETELTPQGACDARRAPRRRGIVGPPGDPTGHGAALSCAAAESSPPQMIEPLMGPPCHLLQRRSPCAEAPWGGEPMSAAPEPH